MCGNPLVWKPWLTTCETRGNLSPRLAIPSFQGSNDHPLTILGRLGLKGQALSVEFVWKRLFESRPPAPVEEDLRMLQILNRLSSRVKAQGASLR